MIVLDCCAAIEIARKTNRGNALRMLIMDEEEVIAPDLFLCEVTNAVWKLCAFAENSQKTANKLLRSAIAQVNTFVAVEDYFEEAFFEACSFKHPAYDLFYAVLARRTGATLFTVDKKLMELCEQMGVNVVAEIDF